MAELKAAILENGRAALITAFSCDRLQNKKRKGKRKAAREWLEAEAPCQGLCCELLFSCSTMLLEFNCWEWIMDFWMGKVWNAFFWRKCLLYLLLRIHQLLMLWTYRCCDPAFWWTAISCTDCLPRWALPPLAMSLGSVTPWPLLWPLDSGSAGSKKI